MNLYDAVKGKTYTITGLGLSGKLKDRLFYMGIFKGEKAVTVGKAPFFGPILIEVSGVTVGIRRDVAEKITVKEI